MLTVTIIQTNLYWEDKEANRAMLQNKIENIEVHTDLVILPEMFSTGFSMQPQLFAETMDGETVEWMRNLAIEKKTTICGSLIITEGGKYFNRFIWMHPNGIYEIYDKRHLFAFAGEDLHYSAGNKQCNVILKGYHINCLVCYDLRFPVWARQPSPNSLDTSIQYYDIQLVVANWPEKRARAWKTLLVARAIENQAYVIGVNRVGEDGNGNTYSGNSMVIDPMGEVLYHKAEEEDIFTFKIEKERLSEIRSKLPFLKDADDFRLE